MVSRVESGAIASVFASQTPCKLSYATTGSLARERRAGRHRGRRQPGEDALAPGAPSILRGREGDARGAARAVPAVLEERDRGGADGVGVRLDLRLVLAVRVRLPVAVDARAHDLAVALDTVACIDRDDVRARPAGDPVDAAVVLGRDPVVARSRDDAIGAVAAGEEVRASCPEDLRGRGGGSDGGQRREEQSNRQARAHR